MAYRNVQFIGYEIFTGPKDPGTSSASYPGQQPNTEDLKTRIQLMEEAIQTAAACKGINKDSDTLKVFMAPEFYFRGPDGAYDLDLLTGNDDAPKGTPALIPDLTNTVSGSAYSDWLFVFGTGLFRSLDPQTNMYEIYNVALVQKGGYSSPEDQLNNRIAVMKEFKSGIDFLQLPPSGLSDAETTHLPAIGDASYTKEINTPGAQPGGGYNGGSIFNLDGITFGLEICLDHAKRRLVRAAPQTGQLFPQLQLIPSGGMTIESSAVATCKNGLVFNVDGLGNDAMNAYGFHAILNQVRFALPRDDSDLDDVLHINLTDANSSLTQVEKVFFVPNGQTPKIAVFPTQAIPAPVPAA